MIITCVFTLFVCQKIHAHNYTQHFIDTTMWSLCTHQLVYKNWVMFISILLSLLKLWMTHDWEINITQFRVLQSFEYTILCERMRSVSSLCYKNYVKLNINKNRNPLSYNFKASSKAKWSFYKTRLVRPWFTSNWNKKGL